MTTHPLYRPPRRPRDDRALIRELLDPTLTRAEADAQLAVPSSLQQARALSSRDGFTDHRHEVRGIRPGQ